MSKNPKTSKPPSLAPASPICAYTERSLNIEAERRAELDRELGQRVGRILQGSVSAEEVEIAILYLKTAGELDNMSGAYDDGIYEGLA